MEIRVGKYVQAICILSFYFVKIKSFITKEVDKILKKRTRGSDLL